MRFAGSVMVLALMAAAACSGNPKMVSGEESHTSPTAAQPSDPAAIWADSVMEGMTLEERAGQLFMPAVYSRMDPADMEMLRYYADSCHAGGILLLKGDAESAAGVARSFTGISALPPWIAIDAEWGLGMRISDAPQYPRNGYLDAASDERDLYAYGEEMARECRVLGINMVMGPVVDIASRESFIGSRSFGEDPQRVADLAIAYARGLEAGGVVSVAKHFPGHGRGRMDSHRERARVNVSRDSLELTDLYPFRRYADAELSAIMAGHISATALDSAGLPATVSHRMLTDLLRGDIGFRGIVITDALNMGGASGYRAADAISAGADIVVAPVSTFAEIREVLERVKSGRISAAAIADRCRRVLLFKYRHRVAGPLRRRQPHSSASRLPIILSFHSDSLRSRLSK